MTASSPTGRPAGRQVLTATEFDALWELLGLGAVPAVLRLPGARDGRGAEEIGWAGLRRRGLAGPQGPEPGLVRLLHLTATADVRLELRSRTDRELRALAADGGAGAVLAVRQDATVIVQPCGGPTAALLSLLPPAPPGPGPAVTVLGAALTAALTAALPGARTRTRPAELLGHDATAADAASLERMLATLIGRSVFAVPGGGPSLEVIDTRHGRYLCTRGPAGTTVVPVDARRLRARVTGLLTAPTRPGGRSAAAGLSPGRRGASAGARPR